METPELEKLIVKEKEFKVLQDFINWLEEQNITFCDDDLNAMKYENPLRPLERTPRQLIAQYLGINLDAVEQEKQALVEERMNTLRQQRS